MDRNTRIYNHFSREERREKLFKREMREGVENYKEFLNLHTLMEMEETAREAYLESYQEGYHDGFEYGLGVIDVSMSSPKFDNPAYEAGFREGRLDS